MYPQHAADRPRSAWSYAVTHKLTPDRLWSHLELPRGSGVTHLSVCGDLVHDIVCVVVAVTES
jgi:hypothetical protein